MTPEEYLRACGWKIVGLCAGRDPGGDSAFMEVVPIGEAVEAQLAEDRARLAFNFKRSVFVATWPDGKTLTVDFTNAEIVAEAKEPL